MVYLLSTLTLPHKTLTSSLDRVKQKLAGWKANLLSLASRAVLIQASSSTIPSYVMQCSYLPTRILEGMDQVNWNFLWGTSESTRKVHWVGWQKVTKPKKEGGLGLQAAKGRNTALLAKLNWRFHTEKDSLWAHVLKSKYCSSQRLASRNQNKLPCSQTWSAMKKGREVFNRDVKWTIGRSSNLSFWYDHWANHGVLRSLVTGPLSREDLNMKIRDIFKDNMRD